MKILNLLASGEVGGIEILCKDIMKKSNLDNRLCVIFDEGSIYNELKDEGYKVFSLKSENKNIFNIAKSIAKYCEDEKIDIIVIHHGGLTLNIIYILLHSILKKKKINIKYIRYLHGCFDKYAFGNSTNKIKNYIIKIGMQKAFNISDMLIFISKAVKESFEQKFKLVNNKIIYNGISNKFYTDIKIKKDYENNLLKLIYVGRLYKTKGISILISACKILKDNNINFKLTIVGDGEEKDNLKKQVKELRLEEYIIFAGKQTDVINWLDNADIFIYPSIWEEGFGISVIEAMSRGCIPVTFNKGALPEIIDNNKNGFIVNEDNANELAKKLIEIHKLANQTREEIIKNAIERSKKYTIENTINNLELTYKELLRKEEKK